MSSDGMAFVTLARKLWGRSCCKRDTERIHSVLAGVCLKEERVSNEDKGQNEPGGQDDNEEEGKQRIRKPGLRLWIRWVKSPLLLPRPHFPISAQPTCALTRSLERCPQMMNLQRCNPKQKNAQIVPRLKIRPTIQEGIRSRILLF